ncbi:hypothetical protein HSBAA_36540 [Vreelandella sulfidaeris]|uniref:Uncharacterized protein n=1 Tax=Vreelandella sulfidaeris TaxID=115553 RepID=A0A455UDE3_9GAMM|nr:hypothetical protein HSBAA_36540 [Halomonas sulfidaeris]
MMNNPLPEDWRQWLGNEFQADYMLALKEFLAEQKAAKKTIYPHSSHWFRAFELTPSEGSESCHFGARSLSRPPSGARHQLFRATWCKSAAILGQYL